jgi:hypothetical protein
VTTTRRTRRASRLEFVRARSWGGDPAKTEQLRARFRILGPHEPLPSDASIVTRNACGTKTNERADLAYILESPWPDPDSPWGFVTGCPDLSTLLGLGGKGQNLDLKEFLRDEMPRRFPDPYPHREDLPNEEEVLRRSKTRSRTLHRWGGGPRVGRVREVSAGRGPVLLPTVPGGDCAGGGVYVSGRRILGSAKVEPRAKGRSGRSRDEETKEEESWERANE